MTIATWLWIAAGVWCAGCWVIIAILAYKGNFDLGPMVLTVLWPVALLGFGAIYICVGLPQDIGIWIRERKEVGK